MSWQRRLERRELHRSRSLSSSIALIATALLLAAGAVLVVLANLGQLPEGFPADGIHALLVDAGGVSTAIGAALLLIGLVWLVLGLAPGRRSRRALEREGIVVVVDDAALASAISGVASRAGRVSAGDARTVLSRGSATTTLRADAGFEADVDAARTASSATIEALRPRHALRSTVEAGAS